MHKCNVSASANAIMHNDNNASNFNKNKTSEKMNSQTQSPRILSKITDPKHRKQTKNPKSKQTNPTVFNSQCSRHLRSPRLFVTLTLFVIFWSSPKPVLAGGRGHDLIESPVVDKCRLQLMRRGDVGYLPTASDALDWEQQDAMTQPRSMVSSFRRKCLLFNKIT